MKKNVFTNDVSIVLCGGAGQGVQTIEAALTQILKKTGYHVYACKEYMSRIRGGSNSTQIRIASRPVAAYVERIDLLLPLDRAALEHVTPRISDTTCIIGEREKLQTGLPVIDIPVTQMAKDAGGALYANTIAVGVVLALIGEDPKHLDAFLTAQFGKKGNDVVRKNQQAGRAGYGTGKKLADEGTVSIDIEPAAAADKEILVNGSQAVALGAIAGGCNFVASYPMSPSTGVLTYLSRQAHRFGIVAEQAEDEISAVNMGIGAWYAGARAITTTSGGGFALMCEGVSLAAMTETPMVIYIAQRPGPATGLPTRTEQGDLNLVLYAGHGEFPRIILAPGTLQEAFYLSQQAFNLADRFQVPVFILTDQYLVDSYYTTPAFDPGNYPVENHMVPAAEKYRRYALTDDGFSPRAVPGSGPGLVAVDSDEHDEEGHITEDLDLRIKMQDKRLKKADQVRDAAVPPVFSGPEKYRNLLVTWGSTYAPVAEALKASGRDDCALLHFGQVFPVPVQAMGYLEKAKKVTVIEGNATGQFAEVLRRYGACPVHDTVLKYNGMPYSVEEITRTLKAL